jgi:hypothetical protein
VNPFKAFAAFVAAISPKVKGGLIWGTLATLAVAFLSAITPGQLAWAGPWAPVLFSAIPLLTAQIAAWTKTDPLRVKGQQALAAEQAAGGVEVPDVPPAPAVLPPVVVPIQAVPVPEPAADPAPAPAPEPAPKEG